MTSGKTITLVLGSLSILPLIVCCLLYPHEPERVTQSWRMDGSPGLTASREMDLL